MALSPLQTNRKVTSPHSDRQYPVARSTLVADLSLPYQNKVNHSLSKVEREVDKLNRILDLERQRAEQAKIKSQLLEE